MAEEDGGEGLFARAGGSDREFVRGRVEPGEYLRVSDHGASECGPAECGRVDAVREWAGDSRDAVGVFADSGDAGWRDVPEVDRLGRAAVSQQDGVSDFFHG